MTNNTRHFIIDTKESQARALATINKELQKIEDKETAFCNKECVAYPEDDIFTCKHSEETYHVDYKKTASDGAEIMEDNLEEYEAVINLDNWAEYDGVR